MTHEQAIAAQDVVRPLHFVDTEQQSHVPVPLARISTCGLITVEVLQEVVSVDPPCGRYRVLTPQQIRGRGAVPALMLLKLLVSRPHRFATKDWLATHLQDEMDMGALVRLDTIASYLRKMLCGMEGFDDVRVLLVAYLRNGRGSGPGYQLAESPFVWLDTDALRFQVEHAALMERMGEPDAALPFWERAVALGSRGTYLADDPFSEWAEDQRSIVTGHVRQSVHSLYRLSMKNQDEASHAHALLLLRTYWQAHKTDEDALRPLLEHLGKHERYQEAEEYYQQCVAALDEWESGRLPDPRTQDMREFLHTKQLVRHRETQQSSNKTDAQSLSSITYFTDRGDEIHTPFSQESKQGIINVMGELIKNERDQSRRQILSYILKTVGTALLVPTGTILHSLEQINLLQTNFSSSSLYEHLLFLSWEHYYTSSSRTLRPILDECLHSLTLLAQENYGNQTELIALLCQFYQLSGVVARDILDIPRALSDGKKAIELAFVVDNTELIASSLFRRAKTYIKQFQYERAVQEMEASLIYAQRSRDPLKGYVHQATAEAYTLLATPRDQHIEYKSLALLDCVEDILGKGTLEDDGSFVKVNVAGLSMDRARVLTHFQKQKEARQTLLVTRHHLGSELTRWKSRLLIIDAEISFAEKNIYDCCEILMQALKIVRVTDSQSNERHIQMLYQRLSAFAPEQPCVSQLGEQLHFS